jgi:aminopeptidase
VPDPRLTSLAEILCRYSLAVEPDDLVLVTGPALAQPLFLELVKTITDMGAHPLIRPELERVESLYMERASRAQLEAVTRLDELEVELPQRSLVIWAQNNTRNLSSAPPENLAIRSAARRGLFDRENERLLKGELHWCGTCFPCHAGAQEAGMSLAEWEDFVYTAGHVSDPDPIAFWRAQSERQAAVIERLRTVRELRLVADGTDITVDVGGRTWLNADGRENFPDGEVYTSPVESATRGRVRFTYDAPYNGVDVGGVELEFEDGRVVRESAERGGDYLTRMLDQDTGARYLGEIGIGLNDEIQRPTHDTLFDEKMGGTFHLALGIGFPQAGGTNSSGLHWDMVCDLRQGGEVYGDGELLFSDGRFLL